MFSSLIISVIIYLLFCCPVNVGDGDLKALYIIIFYHLQITEDGISSRAVLIWDGVFCNKNNSNNYLEFCVFPSLIQQIFMHLVNARFYFGSFHSSEESIDLCDLHSSGRHSKPLNV